MELDVPPVRFKELRNEYPNTIFILIAQENQKGTTFSGQTLDYIANVIVRVHRVDGTFANNYASMEKNRGNDLNKRYYFVNQKVEEINLVGSDDAQKGPLAGPKHYERRLKSEFKRAGEAWADIMAETGLKQKDVKPVHTKKYWRWIVLVN